jgi:alkyldihydroxyacetonephosphate synthase
MMQRFGPLDDGEVQPPRLEDLKLETPRLNPPASLPFCSTALYDRAAHTYGKSFPDYVRGLVGDYSNAPDVVAYPRTEEEIAAVLDWAGGAQACVTPFGGGSSVVGGVEPRRDAARYKAAVTIDLRELGRVLEVDKTSRAARIEAGAFGPALEAAQTAWAHALSFPAEFRVLNARRLDRDPLRRSFRHSLHPY